MSKLIESKCASKRIVNNLEICDKNYNRICKRGLRTQKIGEENTEVNLYRRREHGGIEKWNKH